MIPKRSIRRFDVMAEVKRQEYLKKNPSRSEDEAKGYGIWLAKLIASRGYYPKNLTKDEDYKPSYISSRYKLIVDKLKASDIKVFYLSDEPQTAEMFDRSIVERMGEDFYKEVFSPKIASLLEEGLGYMDFRDSVREELNSETKA